MKKLIISTTLSVALVIPSFAGMGNGYTGQPAPQVTVLSLVPSSVPVTSVMTNNITVQSISLTTSAATPALVQLFDCGTTNPPYFGTNYVNTNTWYSTAGYVTNYVTYGYGTNYSTTGTLLLTTSYFTNAGWWTYAVTNSPTTNGLAPQAALVAVSGTVATYNNPISFQQGLCILASTNCTAIIYWTPNK